MTEIIELGSQEELDSLIASGERVVVDFYAEWCGPCKILERTIKETTELGKVYKMNVDFGSVSSVRTIPTIIIFDGGIEVKKNVGLLDSDGLRSFIINE